MKKLFCASLMMCAVMTLTPARAQKGNRPFDVPPATHPPAPPPVYQWRAEPAVTAPPAPVQPGPVYVYDQKPVMAGRPVLITQEQAQTIINRFKEAYPKLGSPRLLIYVNRELVDEHSGLKLIRRSERIEGARNTSPTNAGATIRSTGENAYRVDEKPQPTLADKQTVRDVERLFGRPLRAAGATLVDQKVATELIADKPLDEFIGTTDTPQARKQREALNNIADTVIEILISSRTITVPAVSGDQTVVVPDIQATAINLKDSKILAQASSADVTTRVPPAALAGFSVPEITEATALALMEDLAPAPK